MTARAGRGPRSGKKILTGVLAATMHDPSGQGPGAQTKPRAHVPEKTPASAASPALIFTPARRPPQGISGLNRSYVGLLVRAAAASCWAITRFTVFGVVPQIAAPGKCLPHGRPK
jgi:hypothetical protein